MTARERDFLDDEIAEYDEPCRDGRCHTDHGTGERILCGYHQNLSDAHDALMEKRHVEAHGPDCPCY